MNNEVFLEPVVVNGWNSLTANNAEKCSESIKDYIFFDGENLMCYIMKESIKDSTSYRFLPPPVLKTPHTADEILSSAESRGFKLKRVYFDSLHKTSYGKWMSDLCRKFEIRDALKYAKFSDGLLQLRVAEFIGPRGEVIFEPIPF